MTLELDDQAMANRLRGDLEGAAYHRSTSSFAPRSRTPIVVGAAGIASVVAAATVIGGVGSSSPALAWSPTPTAATAAEEAAATAACSADLDSESQRNRGDAPSFVLPPLAAIDLRGTGGLATFADENMTFTCLLVRRGDGFERGPIVGEETGATTDAEALAVNAATSTEWSDGRTISMITGVAPAGANSVEVEIAGQPTATAVVTDGRFAMWWFGSVDTLTGSVSAIDASGAELAQTDFGGRTTGSDSDSDANRG